MEASWKDLAQQRGIPYVKGHELPIVHDMVKWITGSIIHREFWNHEPSRRLAVDDVRVERREEHVIQSLTNKARGTPTYQIPYLLLYWQMGRPVCYERCNRGVRTCLLGHHYRWLHLQAKHLRP